MSRAVDSSSPERFNAVGGKARALAELDAAGFPVPEWFALEPAAFAESLGEEAQASLAQEWEAGPAGGLRVLGELQPSEPVRREIEGAVRRLCPEGGLLAVRSSAAEEDGSEHSFAGQLESFLFVRPEDVPRRVADVWRSAFSERVRAYRRERGLAGPPRPPAVLVQRMVNADVSGVAFSADPVSGQRGTAVVSALFGLGTALVSGACDADTFRVDRAGRLKGREIAEKRWRHRADPGSAEGVAPEPVEERRRRQPSLADDQVRDVADLARRAERHFGRPQDVEWALEGSRLLLVQSRPITSLSDLADPDGERGLWDNSNIAESYGGVTTPLTFSFARRAYEEVYRQFCHLMAVPRADVEAHADTFRRMLGLVRGRVYYNLLSWYRVLALLPGFSVNRRFMEQMMGVKEGLPEEVLAEVLREGRGRVEDALRLGVTVLGLFVNHLRLPSRRRAFCSRLEEALKERDLESLRLDELCAYYRDLERRLLTRWDAPIVNDFFAMIFYGLLRRLCEKWCGDRGGSLQNNLLCGQGDLVSAEPALRVREMAEAAVGDPSLVAALCTGAAADARRAAAASPELARLVDAYLARFGDRCLDELKLETLTLADDPLLLLRSVGQFAARLAAGEWAASGTETRLRDEAEAEVRERLRGSPVKARLFAWVLRNARDRVRDRENLRFERTRLFGRVRRVFVEVGKRLYADHRLEDPRDVFWLEVEEALGFAHGTVTCSDLEGLAALRRAEFDRYRQAEPPADRFETRGAVHQGNLFEGASRAAASPGEELRGLGCCPGVVEGVVRVVRDPREAKLERGEILVAERTDPGWIMLFPAAAGLLVERGSLLSHSAIVARELGIPAVVSIPGVTSWLRDGDRVRMDGQTGVVRRLGGGV